MMLFVELVGKDLDFLLAFGALATE